MTDTLSEFSTDAVEAFVRSPPGMSSCPRPGYDRLPVVERRSWGLTPRPSRV
jgi:hypothetical protein